MTELPWFWAITDQRQGPDFAFWATFAPNDAAQLATFIERYRPSQFIRHSANPDTIQYWDAHAYGKLQAQQRGEDAPIWVAATLDVRGHELSIYHHMGGQDYHDTPLINALAHAPELTLHQWRVSYGGDGYGGGDAAQGTEAQSLVAYLKGNWPSGERPPT